MAGLTLRNIKDGATIAQTIEQVREQKVIAEKRVVSSTYYLLQLFIRLNKF